MPWENVGLGVRLREAGQPKRERSARTARQRNRAASARLGFRLRDSQNPALDNAVLPCELQVLTTQGSNLCRAEPAIEGQDKERKQNGRSALSRRVDQLLFIFVTEGAANVASLMEHFDRIGNRTPEPVNFQDAWERADFQVDGARGHVRIPAFRLVRSDVLARDIADQPPPEFLNHRLERVMVQLAGV